MQAEREMYEDSHLRGVICNAEMIKREIIEDLACRRRNPRYL
jgi:UDP-glucose:(heptosyl)LPS alpha-1,3-glucosyltransferase